VPWLRGARSIAIGRRALCWLAPDGAVHCRGDDVDAGNSSDADCVLAFSEPASAVDLASELVVCVRTVSGRIECGSALGCGGEAFVAARVGQSTEAPYASLGRVCWSEGESRRCTRVGRSGRLLGAEISDGAEPDLAMHQCVVTGRALSCEGNNEVGQLGVAPDATQSMPVRVVGPLDVETVVTSVWATCAGTVNGEVWCWGLVPGLVSEWSWRAEPISGPWSGDPEPVP
jgi:hypothetical protein